MNMNRHRGRNVLPRESDRDIENVGRGGLALVHYAFDYNHWEFRQETGADRGTDCILEYIDGKEWHHSVIKGQIKGTKIAEYYLLKSGEYFSFPLEKRTINYALRSNDSFLLFFSDLKNEIVYYLSIQDYFINNPDEYVRLEKETNSMNMWIPVVNIVRKDDDSDLVQLSKASYSFVSGRVQKIITTN